MPVSTRSQSPGWWVGGGYSIVNSQTLLCLVSSTHSGYRASVSNVHFYLYNLKTFRNKYPFSLYCSVILNKIAISAPEALVSIGSLLHYRVRSWLWQTDTRKACITKNQWCQAVSLSKACHNSFCWNLSSGMVRRKSKIRMICIVVWLM